MCPHTPPRTLLHKNSGRQRILFGSSSSSLMSVFITTFCVDWNGVLLLAQSWKERCCFFSSVGLAVSVAVDVCTTLTHTHAQSLKCENAKRKVDLERLRQQQTDFAPVCWRHRSFELVSSEWSKSNPGLNGYTTPLWRSWRTKSHSFCFHLFLPHYGISPICWGT